jgi:hypothetical protein
VYFGGGDLTSNGGEGDSVHATHTTSRFWLLKNDMLVSPFQQIFLLALGKMTSRSTVC